MEYRLIFKKILVSYKNL